MEQIVKNTMESLKKNKIDAKYFETSREAVDEILKEIKPDETVGIGGSVTIRDLGLDKMLKDRGNEVYWHWLETTPEDSKSALNKASQADVYLASTNALTQDGKLVNTDGTGNRVTAMAYGPKRTIVICGVNKIVENLDAAFERIENNAYKNARRLKLNTPCAINGKCADCRSPQRMCNITTVIRHKPYQKEITVIIVNEELGY